MTEKNETKSKNSEPGAALIEQMQQRFAGLWRRLTTPLETDTGTDFEDSYVSEFLSNLKERAYLERTVANQYRGRYLFELIQNAVDAMHKQADLQSVQARPQAEENLDEEEQEAVASRYRCHVELTPLALYVANDGQSFEEADVRGVSAMGQSTKPAGEYIGYKGLGFRAVLEVTDAPEIYSGPFQFGFSREETLKLLAGSGSGAALDGAEVPVLAVPQLRAVSKLLPQSEREMLEHLQNEGYVTIVRLPLKKDFRVYSDVREACQQLVSDQTLLFLPYITELSVAIVDENNAGSLTTISKSSHELVVKPLSLAETVRVSRLGFRRNETQFGKVSAQKVETGFSNKLEKDQKAKIDRQDWLLVEARQPLTIDAPELIARLEDPTWSGLKQVGLATAYPLARLPWGGGDVFLKRRVEPVPFFAHFPTQEGSGLGFAVNSDFYLSASRKQIEWDVDYNQWLANKVISFICGPALEAVHYLYPDDAALIEIMSDRPFYNDRFGRAFREALDNRLATTAFVPVGNGNYMPPGKVVWTPLEQDGVLIFRRVFRYPGDDLYYPVIQLEQIHSTDAAEELGTNDRYGYGSRTKRYDTDYSNDYYPSDSKRYDTDYASDPYYDRDTDSYDSPRTTSRETEPEFDYDRIRRYLSGLGVKKLTVNQLEHIFNQALEGWENGLILTGEICAALALWYVKLGKNEEAQAQRRLIEQARNLPVLPTINAGWVAPENPHYSFADATENSYDFEFDGHNFLVPGQASLLEGVDGGRVVLEISPEAYELAEYQELVHNWHQILGVRRKQL